LQTSTDTAKTKLQSVVLGVIEKEVIAIFCHVSSKPEATKSAVKLQKKKKADGSF